MILPPPRTTLFPYTTLFRSTTKLSNLQASLDRLTAEMQTVPYAPANPNSNEQNQLDIWRKRQAEYSAKVNSSNRSEEHTSELQSPDHLVCRLLLEKKKT